MLLSLAEAQRRRRRGQGPAPIWPRPSAPPTHQAPPLATSLRAATGTSRPAPPRGPPYPRRHGDLPPSLTSAVRRPGGPRPPPAREGPSPPKIWERFSCLLLVDDLWTNALPATRDGQARQHQWCGSRFKAYLCQQCMSSHGLLRLMCAGRLG